MPKLSDQELEEYTYKPYGLEGHNIEDGPNLPKINKDKLEDQWDSIYGTRTLVIAEPGIGVRRTGRIHDPSDPQPVVTYEDKGDTRYVYAKFKHKTYVSSIGPGGLVLSTPILPDFERELPPSPDWSCVWPGPNDQHKRWFYRVGITWYNRLLDGHVALMSRNAPVIGHDDDQAPEGMISVSKFMRSYTNWIGWNHGVVKRAIMKHLYNASDRERWKVASRYVRFNPDVYNLDGRIFPIMKHSPFWG